MGDAIRRIYTLIFGNPQPMEWWLLGADLAIVVLIIWLDVPDKVHHWRRKKVIRQLVKLLNDGQILSDGSVPPNSQATEAEVQVWNRQVEAWIIQVQSFLREKSQSALSIFSHHELGPLYGLRIHVNSEKWFYELNARLKNLRSIIERSDVYF